MNVQVEIDLDEKGEPEDPAQVKALDTMIDEGVKSLSVPADLHSCRIRVTMKVEVV